LGLDLISEPLVEICSVLTRRIRGLAIKVLSRAHGLVRQSLSARFGITGYAPNVFLHFSADVSGGPFNAILIHKLSPGCRENARQEANVPAVHKTYSVEAHGQIVAE
jgi:hypothetical protein